MPTSISAWQSFLRKNIVSPNVWEGESETSVKDKRDYANQSAFWFYIPGVTPAMVIYLSRHPDNWAR